jgi:hypothetical protein
MSADQANHPDRSVPDSLACLALAVLTVAAFCQVCKNDFINYDDPAYVTRNRYIQQGLTGAGVWWSLTTTEAANWHPLTWVSLQLDYQLFGLAPWGFHLTSLLLHTASVVLLFLALRRMTGARWRSALVAALFAVHPLHVESVAWVAERKDVLSTFFGMLTLVAYARYAQRPTLARYLLVFFALALGLAAKPMLVTWPCILLLLDYWPLRRWPAQSPAAGGLPEARPPGVPTPRFAPASPGRLLAEKIPLFGLAAASALITLLAQQQGGAVRTL